MPLMCRLPILIALFTAAGAGAQSYRVTHDSVELIVPGQKALPPGPPTEILTSSGIVWNVYYEDVLLGTGLGFDAAGPEGAERRARLADCVAYIGQVLNQPGELDLMVGQSFKNPENPAPGSFLARGGTGFDCSENFSNGYGFHRLTTGTKALPGEEDIFIQFNFDYTWHAGSGPAPSGSTDLQTVILHEITHGLGLMGIADANGASLLTGCTPPATGYTVWDGLLRRGDTGDALFGGAPLGFLGVTADLRSGDVVFAGMDAVLGYDQQGTRPAIYAPSTFRLGSSLAHFGTNQIVGGPIVMEHAIAPGTTLRAYQPVEIGALRDIGYANAADPDAPGCDGLGGTLDACGVCRGDGQSCLGCDGVPFSGAVEDRCDICGGEGLDCFAIEGQGGFRIEGDSLRLNVTGPTERLQWLRDGLPLAGETGTVLEIPSLAAGDSGSYRVQYVSLSKSVYLSNPIVITVVAESELPLDRAALLALTALTILAVACLRLKSWKTH